jgi:hypothetical protein
MERFYIYLSLLQDLKSQYCRWTPDMGDSKRLHTNRYAMQRLTHVDWDCGMVCSSEETLGGQIAESPISHSNRTGFRCRLLTEPRISGVNWIQDTK